MRLRLVAALGLIVWLGGCSEGPGGPSTVPAPAGLIASDPVLITVRASTGAVAQLLVAGDSTVYVSLFPGTVPGGSHARVHVVGSVNTVIASVFDGGFDPVPVLAGVGDSIEVVVSDAGGAVVKVLGVAVKAARPPVVVRTEPPPRKRDVPLNASIVVVFSEPVDGNSLGSSSVQLFRGSSPVAGTVALVPGNGTIAAFTPAASLTPNTDYRLVVTSDVRDLDGDHLSGGLTLDFTTGQALIGPPASVEISASDSGLSIVTGTTLPLAATVRDAAGNLLTDQPVTWSSSDPGIVSVSPTGVITALADGNAVVSASVGQLRDFLTVLVSPSPAASIVLVPAPATVTVGDTIVLTATVRDAAGRLINRPSLSWNSSAPAVATVAADQPRTAIVTGVTEGSATISASAGSTSETAAVTVGPALPVASVMVTPASASVVLGGAIQLAATLRDANGKVLYSRPTTWVSSDVGVATVDATGLVTAAGTGAAVVTASSEGVSGTGTITVITLTFTSLDAGGTHSCARVPSGAVFCWGDNSSGQLGDGSTVSKSIPSSVNVSGLTFTAVSTGYAHSCALTTSGGGYCWGANPYGQLGDGSTTSSPVPVAVNAGGLTFAGVSGGGSNNSCGITTNGAAYCWGVNDNGQLGVGTPAQDFCSGYPCSVTPVAVSAAGVTFTAVSSGASHTCGVTTSGVAYCWGDNRDGELGTGSTDPSLVPVAVHASGLTFTTVSAGTFNTCGLASGGDIYCWGANSEGQLGDGSTSSRLVPVAIQAGGLKFTAVSAGYLHTCALTVSGAVYCWGNNGYGELGDGSTSSRLVPVGVTAGGLVFSAVSVGDWHTCGLTSDGVAYCWGRNDAGMLGDGTLQSRNVPVKVAGQP